MAAYPIPNPQYGIYNQNNFSPQTTGQSGLTIDEGKKYFLTFPTAQTTQTEYLNDIGVGGTATFENAVIFNDTVTYNADIEFNQNVIVDGTATLNGNLLCETTANVTGILTAETGIDISISGGITFPDNTTQTTAYNDTNAVQNDQSNTFLSPFIQTFQGSNATIPSTGPLQINNVSTSEYASFFVDPSPNYDLTLYTAQTGSTAGLTVRNPNYSFTVNPTVGNVASFINSISSSYSISAQNFGVNTTGMQPYNIYNNTTPTDYGLVIANTTGANGSLTLSNNGGNSTTLTSTSTGLTINDNLIMNSNNIIDVNQINGINGNLNTLSNLYVSGVVNVDVINGKTVAIPSLYAAPSYPDDTNKIATTSYVTYAIGQIPSVNLTNYAQLTLGTTQTFSGPITFSGTTTGITQPINTNDTTLATTAYVLANGAIFTNSSFINNTSQTPNASINPSPCSIISTYIPQTTVVNFNNVNFTVSIIGNPLFLIYLCSLTFNVSPFPNSPPSTLSGVTTVLYNNTNTIYSTQYQWSNATTLIIFCPTALQQLTNFNGVSFTLNLQNLGGFLA